VYQAEASNKPEQEKLKRQRWENWVAAILDKENKYGQSRVKEIELEYQDRLQKDLRTLRMRK